jgi:hypothetical protein
MPSFRLMVASLVANWLRRIRFEDCSDRLPTFLRSADRAACGHLHLAEAERSVCRKRGMAAGLGVDPALLSVPGGLTEAPPHGRFETHVLCTIT